ncbi:hypothetical protein L873DRAFT_1824029 [Choiromyces venosus 120613-1]|uniref:Uncharacterized protein n=1 Tax=Choiromyces venosus 120613-1 TaxID=1336337 RepID=A0A3N4IWV4_9PEZI|nr:hypothetical protein L873DRAFT_1824029 [Choiromyces venosus 120613-1]
MKDVLHEKWDKITIEEVNKEILKLPKVMQCCINVQGGNNYYSLVCYLDFYDDCISFPIPLFL